MDVVVAEETTIGVETVEMITGVEMIMKVETITGVEIIMEVETITGVEMIMGVETITEAETITDAETEMAVEITAVAPSLAMRLDGGLVVSTGVSDKQKLMWMMNQVCRDMPSYQVDTY